MLRIGIDTIFVSLRLVVWACLGLMCLLCSCGDDAENSRYARASRAPSVERALLPSSISEPVPADAGEDADGDEVFAQLCQYFWRSVELVDQRAGLTEDAYMAACVADMFNQSAKCQTSMKSLSACLVAAEDAALADAPDEAPIVRLTACRHAAARVSQVCRF